MENVFIKISILKYNAQRQAMQYYQSNTTKIIKNIIGVNPLNRQWVDEAVSKMSSGIQSKGFIRVKYLIQALEKLYFCANILKESQYNDREIPTHIQKTETLYINACLDFIEQNIHNSEKVLKSFSLMIFAVDVVNEINKEMGDKYRQILTRYNVLFNSFSKITELCSLSNNNFNQKQTIQIKALLGLHSASLKMYPNLKAELIDIVYNRLDEYIIELSEDINFLLTDEEPSLTQILGKYNSFNDMFTPLSELFEKKRYKDILLQREKYLSMNQLVVQDYQDWLKLYQYYSLPRNKIDETKILSTINNILKNTNLFESNFIEFNNLSPSPAEIRNFFITLLNEQGKDSIINYYKIENELFDAPESDKKYDEVIRFIKHLNDKITEANINEKLKNELSRMKTDFLILLDNSIEYKIKTFLATNPSENRLKHFFDGILTSLYDLNDIEKITYWKNIKKSIIKAKHDVPTSISNLKKDFDIMTLLPESQAKNTLKEKLLKEVEKVNEIMLTMVLYQIGEFHEYLSTLTEIEKSLTIKQKQTVLQNRLIILDKFTSKNIVIFKTNILRIGRDSNDNDIILKSDWVSSSHCSLDFQKWMLIDHGSTNGTKIKDRVAMTKPHESTESYDIRTIKVFNIADAFDIHVEQFQSFIRLKVIKIYDNELVSNDREYVKNLFNTDFIYAKNQSSISLDIFTGSIKETDDTNLNEIVIRYDEFFIITDKENKKEKVQLNENEDYNTDRFTFTIS